MLVLDSDLTVLSASPEAERWLAALTGPGTGNLPLPLYAAAARLLSPADDGVDHQPSRLRLRTGDGQWLTVHATRLRGPAGDQIGVVIEPAPATELGSLLLRAQGLTAAQIRVVALVLRGCSTREIVERLHISANTVQEHLTAVFDRFGVRSRRALVAAILGHGEG